MDEWKLPAHKPDNPACDPAGAGEQTGRDGDRDGLSQDAEGDEHGRVCRNICNCQEVSTNTHSSAAALSPGQCV